MIRCGPHASEAAEGYFCGWQEIFGGTDWFATSSDPGNAPSRRSYVGFSGKPDFVSGLLAKR